MKSLAVEALEIRHWSNLKGHNEHDENLPICSRVIRVKEPNTTMLLTAGFDSLLYRARARCEMTDTEIIQSRLGSTYFQNH